MPIKAFQTELKFYLRARGLRQKELAAQLYIGESDLTKLLKKTAPIDQEVLEKICRILKLSKDESQQLFNLNRALESGDREQDQDIESAPTGATSAARSFTFMVPAQITHFTGREHELQAVLAQLSPSSVVTICGPAGVGKTALSIQVAHTVHHDSELSQRFPDGVFFIDFQSENITTEPEEPEQIAFEQIARLFGEEPRPTPLAAAQRALVGRKALIIFDGTERLSDVRGLLNIRGTCGVLLTSRRRADIQLNSLDLAPLLPAAASQLLQAWGKERARDEASVAEICTLVEGLPLALVLAGSYMASRAQDAREYLEWLREVRLDALEGEERQKTSISLLLAQSFRQLPRKVQKAVRIAGCLAYSSFSPETIAAATTQSVSNVRRLLGEGVNYSLLQRIGDRFFFTHSLIHLYTRHRSILPRPVLENLATYFVQLAQNNSGMGVLGHRRLDPEQVHMMAVLTQCVEQQLWQRVSELVQSIDPYLFAQGHWFEQQIAIKYALEAVRHLNLPHQEAQLLSTLGSTLNRLGLLEEALTTYEKSLAIFQSLEDRRGIASVQMGRGLNFYFQGRIVESMEIYDQSIQLLQALYAESNDAQTASSLGKVLSNQGNAYAEQGRNDEALEYYQKSLQIQRIAGDRFSEAQVLGNCAVLLLEKNQVVEAISLFEEARAIFNELGDNLNEAQTQLNLGEAYRRQDKLHEALQSNRDAYSTFHEIGYRRGESIALRGIGEVYHQQRQWDEAVAVYEQSLALAREMNSPLLEGQTLHTLGNVLRDKEVWAEAQTAYTTAQDIFIGAHASYYEGPLLTDMGLLYQRQGQISEAIQCWQKAIAKLPSHSTEYQMAQSWVEDATKPTSPHTPKG